MAGIKIELQLQDGSFTSGMLRAGQSIKSFKSELTRLDPHFQRLASAGQDGFRSFKKMEDGSRSLLGRLRDITVVAGGVSMAFGAISGAGNGLIGNIVKINAEMERLRFQLAGMSNAVGKDGPMRDAARQVRELQESAKHAPFSFKELTNTFVKLKVAGLDPLNGSLQALVDGVAAFGGNDEALHRITLGITQMSGKGVIQMEELRQQLGESMPAAMKLMSRSMGVSLGELTKMIATGRVEAKSALEGFFKEVDLSYGGSASRMMQTFSGQMARIRTAFTQRVTEGEMGKAFDQLKSTMSDIVNILESSQAEEFFNALGRGLQSTLDLAREFFGALLNMRDTLAQWGATIVKAMGFSLAIAGLNKLASGMNAVRVAGLEMKHAIAATAGSFKDFNRASVATQQVLLAQEAMFLARDRRNARAGMARAGAIHQRSGSSTPFKETPEYLESLAVMSSVRNREADLAKRAAAADKLATSRIARVGAGIAGAIGPMMSFGSKFLSVLGPIGIAVGVLGPMVFEVGKGLYSWFTGAKKAKEEIADTMRRLQSETLKSQDGELKAHDEKFRVFKESIDREIAAMRPNWERDIDVMKKKLADLRATMPELPGSDDKNPSVARARRQQHIDEIRRYEDLLSATTAAMNQAEQNKTTIAETYETKRTQILQRQAAERERVRKDLVDQETEDYRALISAETEPARKTFNESKDQAATKYEQDLKAEREAGRLGVQAKKDYQDALTKADRDYLTFRRDTTKKMLDDAKNRANGSVESGKIEQDTIQNLTGDLQSLEEQLQKLDSKEYGINLLTAPENEDKKIERLVRFVNEASDKVMDLSAEANGASGAMAKLMFQIRRGDFGNLEDGSKAAAVLRQELIDAAAAMEMLDGISKTSNEVRTEMGSILDSQRERLWKAKAELDGVDPGDDGEYFAWKYKNNLLGIGKDAQDMVDQQFAKITKGVDDAMPKFQTLASMIQNTTFGKKTLDAISRVSDAIRQIGVLASGIQFGSMLPDQNFTGGNNSANANVLREGLTKRGVPSYVTEAVILNAQDESGINFGSEETVANKHGTKGYGVLQWTGDRRKKLEDRAAARGVMPSDPDVQMDLLVEEWKTTEAKAAQAIFSAKSVGEAAIAMVSGFLRPAKKHENARVAKYSNAGALPVPVKEVAEQATKRSAETLHSDVQSGIQEMSSLEAQAKAAEADAALKKAEDELRKKMKAAKAGDDTVGDRNSYNTRLGILGGEYGNDESPDSQRYKNLLDLAKQLDDYTSSVKKNREDDTEILKNQEKLDEQRLEIAQRRSDAEARLKDPNYKEQSKDLADLNKLEQEHLKLVQGRFGVDSDQYKKAQDDFAEQRKAILGADGIEATIGMRDSVNEAEKATMRKSDLRAREYREEVAAAAAQRDLAIKLGQDKVLIEELYQRQIAAIRKKYQTDLQAQAADMMDIRTSIKGVASAMPKQLSDALYTQDWSSFGDAVREGIARSLTDAAAGVLIKNIFGSLLEGEDGEGGISGMISDLVSKLPGMISKQTKSMGGAGAGGGGFFGAIFKAITSIFTKGATGTAHTGAIIGLGGGGRTMASVANFIGAPKFHSGGIIGKSLGISAGLRRDEVPIIAKRREGVFTPEQMKHLGGTMMSSQSISIAPVIHMNAQGGSPEANADLAKQTARETEAAMRGLVRDELIKQFRTGNMLAGK